MILISYDMISYHIILSYDMILENFRRTDREQRTENRQTENSKTEATLIPVDLQGEQANYVGILLYQVERVKWY